MVNVFGFFDINNILVTLWSYPLSYIEFIGTVFGLIGVLLATKQKIASWPVGLVNVSAFFILFYQVQLYSGMFLQAFYFVTNLYGWYIWRKQLATEQAPTSLSVPWRMWLLASVVILTVVAGYLVQKLPLYFPAIFPAPASQPYYDAFIAIASIAGQILLTRRIIDNWYIWVVVNTFSVYVFYQQGLYLLSLEFFVFLLLALKGIIDWKKTTNHQKV
jgi:nicotinamide mononucleotide transporter